MSGDVRRTRLVKPRALAVGDLVERWYNHGQRVAYCAVLDIKIRHDGNSGTYYVVRIEVPSLLVNQLAPSFQVYPNGKVPVATAGAAQ